MALPATVDSLDEVHERNGVYYRPSFIVPPGGFPASPDGWVHVVSRDAKTNVSSPWTGQRSVKSPFGATFDISGAAHQSKVLGGVETLTLSGALPTPPTGSVIEFYTAYIDRSGSLHSVSLDSGSFENDTDFALPAKRYIEVTFYVEKDSSETVTSRFVNVTSHD